MSPGWCSAHWDAVLWRHAPRWDQVLADILADTGSEEEEYYDEYYD